MKPLSIFAYLDGRLGHEKQTQGILHALSDLTPISLRSQKIASLSFISAVKQWHAYISASIRRFKQDRKVTVDLIIGSGAYTHIPMLLLKKRSGGRAVTCMCPDFFLRKKMDLCFVPEHDQIRPSSNIFITMGPPNPTAFTDAHDPENGLILVGGYDKRSHRWDSNATGVQIKSIVEKDRSIQWTISSSPRTPEDMVQLLEAMAGERSNVDFISSEATPEGWIEKAYGKSLMVWVTADSISMIYEALTAGCRVGILPVQWLKQNSKFRRNEKDLIEKKWVQTYDMWYAGKEMVTNRIQLNESNRCAKEILRRWWPDRLP